MSAGAVFKLIANDGKADRLIMATKLLNQRIQDIMCARQQARKADPTPTLVDLERTHIIFVNAHFKPFAAIGYEYNKVRPQSGTAQLGSGVTFSIPQFGDFWHDIVVRTELSQFNWATQTTAAQGTVSYFPVNGGTTITITSANNAFVVNGMPETITPGTYTTGTLGVAINMILATTLEVGYCAFNYTEYRYAIGSDDGTLTVDFTVSNSIGATLGFLNIVYEVVAPTITTAPNPPMTIVIPGELYSLVDAFGNQLVASGAGTTASFRNLAAYCEYPALRLFSKVCFSVNGNPLDEYSVNASVMLNKFTVPPWKRVGFDRLVGQQVPLNGYGPELISPVQDDDSANMPTGIQLPQGLYLDTPGCLSDIVPLNTAGSNDVGREAKQVVDGPQTPKPQQQYLVLWNKLRFWFCDDVRLAVPSVSIPHGQRFISIELTQASNLIYEIPGLYLRTINDTTILASSNDQRYISFSPILLQSPTGYAQSNLTVQSIEMYINNIFMNPEIHDIYMKRIGFMLIRVFREQFSQSNQADGDEKQLTQLKWPVEYMFVGLRPQYNQSANNVDQWRDWHRMTRQVRVEVEAPVYLELNTSGTAKGLSGAPGYNQIPPDVGLNYMSGAFLYQCSNVQPGITYWLPVDTINTLRVYSHGITIYEDFDAMFFFAYEPYHYGAAALVTPNDEGALFINFSLFPRAYQPSGHLNISRARETFLCWTTDYVSSNTPCTLIVVAIAINFLLVIDGSAVLRYST